MKSHFKTFLLFPFLFSGALLLCSCEEVVDLKISFEEETVLLCDVAPTRPIAATLTKTQYILNDRPAEYERAAQISFTANGQHLTDNFTFVERIEDPLNPRLPRIPFYFFAPENNLSADDQLSISIKLQNGKELKAKTSIPALVAIQDLTLIRYGRNPEIRNQDSYTIRSQFNFEHKDPLTNYHFVFYFSFLTTVRDQNTGEIFFIENTLIPNFDNLNEELSYINDFENGILVAGENIDLGIHDITCNLNTIYDPTLSDFAPRLQVEIRNVSEEYYNYHFVLSRQQQQQDSIINQAFIIPSNVEGGRGFFGAYNYSSDFINLLE